ncbi:MAG: GH92 family glycosyl hydrolase [Mangrovibacterium sp.]
MNKTYRFFSDWMLTIFAISMLSGINQAAAQSIQHVNPFIGTDYHGHTFPGAALPGGMVQLGPDTGTKGWDWCSGYHYSDSSIMGFSHLHRSGMGAADWGDILLMPTTRKLKISAGSKENPDEGYRSRFSHLEEKATPGFYSVTLTDYGIKVQLTVSERAGFHQYTFPESDTSHIIIDLGHGIGDREVCANAHIQVVSDSEVQGYRISTGFVKNQVVYFYAKFSKAFRSSGTWNQNEIKNGSKEDSGIRVGAFINYATSENEIIQVKVGISYTSVEQARLNLEKEIPSWNFERVKGNAEARWGKALDKIKVETDQENSEKLTIFYTALYHSLLFPGTFSDADGKYRGLDNKIHTAKGFTYRSDFSMWDTFRAQMPLLALIEPKRTHDVINTMITQYREGGWLPTPQQFGNSYTNDMIGDHPVSIILDAYRKGIRSFDIESAYEAVRKNALETPPADHPSRGRVDLKDYLQFGYLPYDKIKESVSKTLEYAYNDWCVAQLANDLGKVADYELFMERAGNYKNLIDTTIGFARPKDSNGEWLSPFDPRLVGKGNNRHYTEGNAWQYTWFVPHDVPGLIKLVGGNEKFISKLDSLFIMSSEIPETQLDVTGLIGLYAHGNEPSHHTSYLFNYAGAPWKTQELVRKIMDELYTASPSGLCGNEDMGQMSAWYVLSAMGFYPVAPGQNTWVIGTPRFNKVIIFPDRPDKFTIEARNNSKENKYFHSVILNGNSLNKFWFNHDAFKNGGTLIFEMGSRPNKNLNLENELP